MKTAVDLHSHSIFAGGAGGLSISLDDYLKNMELAKIRFHTANQSSELKGLDILGTGDIQFKPWLNFAKKYLQEEEDGFFKYKYGNMLRYVLQTEIIFTTAVGRSRKAAHTLLLFPDYESVDLFQELLTRIHIKHEKVARPFIPLDTPKDISDFCFKIKEEISDLIEIIPAHIMTPDGFYGGNNGVNRIEDYFEQFAPEIKIVETGLSADPMLLALIPDLDNRTLLSNSDAHSAGLHRIAREFTVLNMKELNYQSLIKALRAKDVNFTLEFPPTEGRYFFTGHRDNRKKPGIHRKGEYCYFSPDMVPDKNICPICKKKLTKGVLQRVLEINVVQGSKRDINDIDAFVTQKYIHGIPLVEVIAKCINIKTPSSKKVLKIYKEVIKPFSTEVTLWGLPFETVDDELGRLKIDNKVKFGILNVINGRFRFFPPGFDGRYGTLNFEIEESYFGHSVINSNN